MLLAPTVASLVLAVVFCAVTEASPRAKVVACVLVCLGLYLQFGLRSAGAHWTGFFLLLAVAIGLILYLTVHTKLFRRR